MVQQWLTRQLSIYPEYRGFIIKSVEWRLLIQRPFGRRSVIYEMGYICIDVNVPCKSLVKLLTFSRLFFYMRISYNHQGRNVECVFRQSCPKIF